MAQLGGKAGFALKKAEGESWNSSSPFIVAFRARKIWYDHSELKDKTHKDKVVMQDVTPGQKDPDMTLQADNNITLSDVFTDAELTVDKDIEDGEEVKWIIPNVSLESA
ncbi:hypothetical protein JMJ35_008161 [Cladonia borealis]|uniref:Uncharacterized protein n=1 Tax=Cladonia borealis TaxID=184061 RepID=A0AA39QV14_9LECA|nr:hypothetical protein JMJ35_008161 [Cladonia borealis]